MIFMIYLNYDFSKSKVLLSIIKLYINIVIYLMILISLNAYSILSNSINCSYIYTFYFIEKLYLNFRVIS